jgi:outer membrane immunogenic protein
VKRLERLVIPVCLIAAANLAAADEHSRGIYGGVKGLGYFSDSDSGLRVVYGAGAMIGYEFPHRIAAEAEFTTPIENGSIDPGTVDGEWKIDTQALYAVWRSRGDAYFKARLGWAWRDVESDPDVDDRAGSGDGASAGAGFGLKITPRVLLEWEATWLDPDYYQISFGVLF